MTPLFITSISIPIHNCGCLRGVPNQNARSDFSAHRTVSSHLGYTTKKPAQFKLQDDGSAQAVAALGALFGLYFETKKCVSQQCDLCSGTRYEHGNIGATIYVASGNTVDWTSGTANVTFSYAVELRDTGKNDEVSNKKLSFPSLPIGEYGFLLPEDQILPTGKETLAGEIALLRYIEKQVYA